MVEFPPETVTLILWPEEIVGVDGLKDSGTVLALLAVALIMPQVVISDAQMVMAALPLVLLALKVTMAG